jgi:MoxR-like ATPase
MMAVHLSGVPYTPVTSFTRYYFLVTVKVGSAIKTRPLPNQKIPSSKGSTLCQEVDTSVNVQCDSKIRSEFPVGTVFCVKDLYMSSGYYSTAEQPSKNSPMFPLSVDEEMLKKYGTTPSMVSAYEAYKATPYSMGIDTVSISTGSIPRVEDGLSDSFLNKLRRDRRNTPPTIEKDGYYVNPDVWYFLLRNIEKNVHSLLIGASGTGKTSLLARAAKSLRKDIEFFDMGGMQDPITGLLGTHRIKMVDGNQVSVFDRANFSKVIETPSIVVLDELSRAPITANNYLFPMLDDRRELPMEYGDSDFARTIKVHDECRFLATANIGAEYSGTNALDRALLDRMTLVELSYLPKEEEIKLLSKFYGISASQSSKIVGVATMLRDMAVKGDLSSGVSVRYTKEVASLVDDGFDLLQALKLIILPLYEGTIVEGEKSRVVTVFTSK